MSDDDATVIYETDGMVAHIILNRPRKLNAINGEMAKAFLEALDRFDKDNEIRVAILRGAGRAFCSGGDVHERELAQRLNPSVPREPLGTPRYLLHSSNFKPIIAAVHGYAVGGGLQLAMSCELILCADTAKFQITETSRGLPAVPMWSLLAERSGKAFANEVALTGRLWEAEEALATGMVNSVVPEVDLVATAQSVAETIASHPPLAVREIVRRCRFEIDSLDRFNTMTGPRDSLHTSEDFLEAATSFVEKRKPGQFTGT